MGSYDKEFEYYKKYLRYHVTRIVTAVEVKDIGQGGGCFLWRDNRVDDTGMDGN